MSHRTKPAVTAPAALTTTVKPIKPTRTLSPLELLPSELLLLILLHLSPIQDLPSLSLTSHSLSDFLSINKPHIYNALILEHHGLEAAIFRPEMRDGWLVPTHPMIVEEETFVEGYIHDRLFPTTTSTFTLPLSIPSSLVRCDGKDERDLLAHRLSHPSPAFYTFLQSSQALNLKVEITLRKELGIERSEKRVGMYYVRRWLDKVNVKEWGLSKGMRSRNNSFLGDKDERGEVVKKRKLPENSPGTDEVCARCVEVC